MFTHVEENHFPLPLKTLRFKEVSSHVQLAGRGSCGIEMLKSGLLSTRQIPLPKERREKQPGHPGMAQPAPRPSAPESPRAES